MHKRMLEIALCNQSIIASYMSALIKCHKVQLSVLQTFYCCHMTFSQSGGGFSAAESF